MAGPQVASLAEGSGWTGPQIACMVNTEINQVMAVMRQNARWAVAPRYLEEELGEDPLLRDFKILRRKLFTWQDWPKVKPTDYLTPFLEVIRSEETSAPITGVALSAVHKVLSYEIFDAKTAGAAEVMHFIVDAVTGCKFEVTDPASEEVVLLKILQVLLACLKCGAGPLLSNADVINIINTCLRVAFTKGELLQRTSCQMMQDMVRAIFARLHEFEPAEDGSTQPGPAVASEQPDGRVLESVPSGAIAEGILSTASTPRSGHSAASTPKSRGAIRSIADIRFGPHPTATEGTPDDGPSLTPRALKAFEEGKSLVEVVEEETSAVKEDSTLGADSLGPSDSAPVSEALAAAGAGIAAGFDAAVTAVGEAVSTAPVVAGVPEAGAAPIVPTLSESVPDDTSGSDAVSGAPPLPPPVRVRAEPSDASAGTSGTVVASQPSAAAESLTAPLENGDSAQKQPAPAASVQASPYGLPCLVEVFRFLCTLIVPEDGADKAQQHDSEDLSIFGLALLSAAIEVAGGSFEKHPRILALVTDDLFRNLMQTGQSSNLLVLSLVSGIVLALYQHLKHHLKLQMAAFFEFVVLRAAQGKFYGATYEQQEAALEILQDFCRQPSFMADMYANADCDITCSNTFEDLSNLLSKNAFPVNAPLSALHLLSLEGLLAVIQCMADRADNASTPAGSGSSSPDYNLEEFPQFWNLKCDNWNDPTVWVDFLRRRKYVKRRLMIGADHFNRDPKKGLEFLQGVRLLPEKLDPESVAFFFRMTPGLNKNLLGEYFGEPDAFNISVLECFTKQFNFTGMALDGALRTYLEAFRLPGEAQKISRVLEAFASHYYEQCPQNFAHKDAAYVLSYSVIMLNTDQHNGQVKRKMTEEEFIRNNRKINDGKDLPRDMLTHLYYSIAKNEIRMSSESLAAEPGMTYSRWLDLLRRSQATTPFLSCDPTKPLLDRDMFSVIWGPSIAAISVVFDHADDADTLQQCMAGFLAVAKISAAHHMEDVFDNLVVSLCKFTTLIGNDKAAVAFGENTKARMATSAVFEIANRHGDTIRSGWRNILDCVIRLHKLGLLPTRREQSQNGQGRPSDNQEGSSILANAAAAAAAGTQAGMGRRKSAGIFGTVSRQFQNLLSLDAGADGERSTIAEHQLAAHQRTLAMVEACRIDDLFTDSKFLHKASLLQLVKALINVSGKPHQKNISTEEEDTALFCLDLLIAVTLRNRDRILLLWPAVHEHLASIVGSAQSPSPLVEKAVLDLLRVCQRLLPYKEDLGDELLKSLQLVLRLDARVADAYAERITREMLQLVKSSVTYIRSPVLWKTVCSLLAATARHPEAAEPGFEALTFIMQDAKHVTPVNFMPCMDAALAFAEGRVGGVERSVKSLDLLASLSTNLGHWAKTLNAGQADTATSASISGAPASDAAREALDQAVSEAASTSATDVPQSPRLTSEKEALIDLWLRLSVGLGRICLDQREDVRNNALECLQRSLLQGEALDVRSGKVWVRVFDQIVFPTLDELLDLAHKASAKSYRGMEGTLRRAMVLLSRVYLQFLTQLASNPGFANLWVAVLNRAEGYLKSSAPRSAGISMAENIPELLKNMLLVMNARSILVPEVAPPAEGEAPTLWSLTWQHPIFRSLDPHFREDLFPPPKAAPSQPAPAVEQAGAEEKQPEGVSTGPVAEAAEAVGEKAADASVAEESKVLVEGSPVEGSKDVAEEGTKPEDVDVAEGYEKVEKEMVEPIKTNVT